MNRILNLNPSKILIKNAKLLSLSESVTLPKGDILIENDLIKNIAPSIQDDHAKIIEATDLIAMPGFIQTHIHLCQTLFRNLANDMELLDWLKHKIWPLEAAHNKSSLAISARLGILELIKSGTTTILDMGSVDNVEIICDEIYNSGMRASIGLTFMDQSESAPKNLLKPAKESFAYFDHLYSEWNGHKTDRITMNLAPRFALSCSEQVLSDIADLAKQKNILIHTHASENRKEVATIRETCGLGNVAYYHKLGMTSDLLCLAHCIWLEENEIRILAENDCRVLHCPSSNLKLGSGIADIPRLQKNEIICSLGADGAPCNNNLNMFWEMRLASLLQKPKYGPRVMPANKIAQMATLNGAKTLHLEKQIGTLDIGKKADIILLDFNFPHTSPGENLFAQMVFAASAENVHSVLIDGKLVMLNRKILILDEEETIRKANEELDLLLQRIEM